MDEVNAAAPPRARSRIARRVVDRGAVSDDATLQSITCDASRLLRRRLHADLSRPDVSRRGLSRVLRARYGMDDRPGAVSRRRSPPRRRCSTAPRTRRTTTRSSSSTRAASSRGWAAPGRALDACASEIYREWAACQHFELYDDVPDVLRELAGGGIAHRADLELAPLPRVVPVALRAARADQRDRLVVRARVHEAAPEHLRRGAAAGRTSRRPRR